MPGDLSADELRRIRELISGLLGAASRDLRSYFDPASNGFFHRLPAEVPKDPGDFSKASTATAVAFLAATGRAGEAPWGGQWEKLRHAILQAEWTSAGLAEDNHFTSGFMLEALAVLTGVCGGGDDDQRIEDGLDRLVNAVEGGGGLHIKGFPPSAYLMQLAVRTLDRFDRLTDELRRQAGAWARNQMHSELVTLRASSKDGDPFEVGYSAVVVARVEQSFDPATREALAYAINEFFRTQLPDGTWPRGRPIFFYPETGNAYCFEYEFLVQLLATEPLQPLLLEHARELLKAVEALDKRKYPLPDGGYGWSSGHHRHMRYPESWSTASVLHFCHNVDRFLAEVARRQIFDYVGDVYSQPTKTVNAPTLTDQFLDSELKRGDDSYSLREVIEQRLLAPLAAVAPRVRVGQAIPDPVASSAIFFGPPGTAKTRLAKHISEALGWPLLVIDPSHLLRHGAQQLHVEMFQLFRMLSGVEQAVVLFDEFDELVRERESDNTPESRFLTTAMLPRLQELSSSRRLIYLLATNHLEVFDAAIRRPGRFDLIVPVLPPTTAEKLRRWPKVGEKLQALDLMDDADVTHRLALLTYGEFEAIAGPLSQAGSVAELRQLADDAAVGCTMRSKVGKDTWAEAIDHQIEMHLRLPAIV